MGYGPVASKKVFTVTLTVDPDQLSPDAREWNCEGFFNLLENLIRDERAHEEFIHLLDSVTGQYKEGAITAREAANALLSRIGQ